MSRRLRLMPTAIVRKVEKKKENKRISFAVNVANANDKAAQKVETPIFDQLAKENSPKAKRKRNRRGVAVARKFCRELDFSAFPVTGTHSTFGIEKMKRDKDTHHKAYEAKCESFRVTIADDIPFHFDDKWAEAIKQYVFVEYNQEEMRKFHGENRMVEMGNRCHNDKPLKLSRGTPKTGKNYIIDPTGNAAKLKPYKPSKSDYQNADRFESKPDMTGQGTVIAEPKYKAAGSFKREIPLALCLWMIAMQEDWTDEQRKESNIITDKKAHELLSWMHANAY